jgi:hypothetical protein
MPTIDETLNVDRSKYTSAPPSPPPSEAMPEPAPLPVRSPLLRFTSPYLPGTFPSSDNLTGYHIGGKAPQYRIPIPAQAPAQGSGSTSASTVVVTSSSSGGVTNNPATSNTASISTPTLSPGAVYTGVITMAKAFVVLTVSVNAAARIELYSTLAAQTSDLARPSTKGPGYGTEQGIIADFVLDTVPVVWQAVGVVGANGDNPQSKNVYISVTNLSNASQAYIVSIQYVPVQS